MVNDCYGKVVLVTGSAQGLGLAIVESFLQNNVKFTIMLDIDEEKGAKQSKILGSKYGENRVIFYKCDVVTDLEEIINKITECYGTVDVVVNNVGILDEKNFRRSTEINLIAMMDWSMQFYHNMRRDKGGKGGTIINMSSVFGSRITPHFIFYQTAKFGILGFTKSLGHKINFEKSGVRVIALCPGFTHTTLTANPNTEEEQLNPEVWNYMKTFEWQSSDVVGRETVKIYIAAESGTGWVIEGSRPAELI